VTSAVRLTNDSFAKWIVIDWNQIKILIESQACKSGSESIVFSRFQITPAGCQMPYNVISIPSALLYSHSTNSGRLKFTWNCPYRAHGLCQTQSFSGFCLRIADKCVVLHYSSAHTELAPCISAVGYLFLLLPEWHSHPGRIETTLTSTCLSPYVFFGEGGVTE
jgi:hypothetical protein